eukprot:1142710-Pelagomonas_calceolata.AAC.2
MRKSKRKDYTVENTMTEPDLRLSSACRLWPLLLQQLHEGGTALHLIAHTCAFHPAGHVHRVP